MRERFRDWSATGMLRCKYVDGNKQVQYWVADQAVLLIHMQRIVNNYMLQGIKLTNRQLYYQLVAAGAIPNADEVYKRICKFLTDARYAGKIDWEAIEDRGRNPEMHSEWNSVKDLVDSAVASYRLPRWKNQEYYLELFCEKEAMENILKPIADKYHIVFGANKGYSSAVTIYDLAKRFKEKIEEGKKAICLYLGDHDSSGLDMIRDIRDRINEFLTEGEEYTEPNFEVIQLALNMNQIKQYNPPPNPAKALALNTLLATPAGWTTMEKVKVGDALFADDGTICHVVSKSDIFKDKKCFEFTFSCGEKIVSSEDHLWMVSARKRKGGVISTSQIAASWTEGIIKRPVYRIHIAKQLILSDVNLPIPPYSLGAWLGDGYSEGYGFACSEKDNEIMDNIAKEGFKIKRYDKIRCGISGLCQLLRKMNLYKNKHIPIIYLRSSYEQRLSLLQGLMDTDGTISEPKSRNEGTCVYSSSRKGLAEQVLELVCSLGLRGNLSESRAVVNGRDVGATWRVEFYPGDIPIFRLKRKQECLKGSVVAIRQFWRTIIDVKEIESVPTQCIAVDSASHLFLAGRQLIPTHNTTDPRAAWYISQYGKVSWELDALKPEVLRNITEIGIRQFMDIKAYNSWIALENQQKKALEDFGKKLAQEEKK